MKRSPALEREGKMFGNKSKEETPDSQVFAYYDSKSGSYGKPILTMNKETLIRDVSNLMRDPNEQARSQLWLNAEDFSIFRIGTYNSRTGEILPVKMEHIVNLHDLRSMIRAEASNITPKRMVVDESGFQHQQ